MYDFPHTSVWKHGECMENFQVQTKHLYMCRGYLRFFYRHSEMSFYRKIPFLTIPIWIFHFLHFFPCIFKSGKFRVVCRYKININRFGRNLERIIFLSIGINPWRGKEFEFEKTPWLTVLAVFQKMVKY